MSKLAASLWLTAAEIAGLKQAGIPDSARRVQDWAAAEGWSQRTAPDGTALARQRRARGGGTEYHASLLPVAVQEALAVRASRVAPPVHVEPEALPNAEEQWAQFRSRSAKVQAEAERRAAILGEVDACVAAGIGKTVAANTIAIQHSTSRSVIFDWYKAVAGVEVADRPAFLAPRHKGSQKRVTIDDGLWQALLSDFLRLSGPSFATCVRRTATLATARGQSLPAEKTLWRRLEKEVPASLITLKREGPDALRRSLPPQKRTVADLHALELVNIDGHTWDVRVEFPDGTIGRPVLIAIQDVYSRKFLAWRYAASEDAITARLCFADLFAKYGLPKGLLSDNGRAFASKWLTGGVETRFRFKVKLDEPTGILPLYGIEIHWALPYRGSSKPIERGFRDFCDGIAKHPAFEGAYTGNSPVNKPDNYGERAVPWATFIAVADAGIHAHNAQSGRRTEMGKGKLSFDQVFDASYAVAPIRKAAPDKARWAMLAAEQVRADKKSGAVKVLGNTFWTLGMSQFAGDMLTVRFDPENAHAPVEVFSRDGRWLLTAELLEATGFLDSAGAKRSAKLIANHRKATKAAAEALNLLTADQLAGMLPLYEDETPTPQPTVVRPVRPRGATAAALKTVSQAEIEPAQPTVIDRFTAGIARLRVVE